VQSPELPTGTLGQSTAFATDYWIIGGLLTLAGIAVLGFFYSRNEILLSGDAVAHINIARRVFDSRTPGLLQLGSVWLPLPHLLTIPFVVNGRMWESGIGGSIVSLVSYIAAGMGLFRLLLMWSRATAWIGTILLASNPNLLYLQTTALNEPLYLATFIWATVFFAEAWRSFNRSEAAGARWLQRGAMALTAAVFTRYDGWFLACVCWAAILPGAVDALRRNCDRRFRLAVFKALLLSALGPTLWFAYNFGVYGNALEFANGPYSAKAIALHSTQSGAPPYPGERRVLTAAMYFVKAAQLNVGDGFLGKILILFSALASAALLRRDWLPVTLLWSPLIFYALSIAYGSIPIFIPVWWPFSYYNARYGLELLPAIAAGVGFSVYRMEKIWRNRRAWLVSTALVVVIAGICYVNAAQRVPICLRETRMNGEARMELDRRVAAVLKSLPPQATVLAYTGAHSGAFEMAGFRLRRTINEGNFFVWDACLAHPATASDYAIAFDGDPVADSVSRHPAGLHATAILAVNGQSRVVIYKSALYLHDK